MNTFTLLCVCFIILAVIIATITVATPNVAEVYGQASEQVSKLVHEGNFLYAQEKYDQALNSFKEVLAIDSNNSYALDRIGLTYLDRALVIDPNNLDGVLVNGIALLNIGNNTEELEYFD